MDSVLIDFWLGGAESTPVLDEASIVLLRSRVQEEGARIGLPSVALGSIVNVASELAHNQLAHARGGRIAIRPVQRGTVVGLEIAAADRGPGIAAPTEALRPRPPSRKSDRQSLGVGLAAVMELADEVDFDVRLGEGSCVWARKFREPVDRRRRVGIFGRPYPGEDESGDDGSFVRSEGELLVGLVDGLGHGPPAREASSAAANVLRQSAGADLDRIVRDCHDALRGTRRGVVALGSLNEPDPRLRAVVLGDVNVQIAGPQVSRRVTGRSFVLGSPGQLPKLNIEERAVGPRDVLILFTDGISARADLAADLDLLREHPIVIAHQVVERYARDNDDALVLVVA
jgi:anti-sigma regulatory factor (Ser/Thr protein kinase)